MTLEPGDILALFSDGVPEATREGERFLELDPVRECLAAHQNDELPTIRDRILSAVEDFLGGEPISDDITLMLLRRSPSSITRSSSS